MADRNEQGQHSDEYRPFDNPHHPSWYTDPAARTERDAAPHPGPAPQAPYQNPYADQPLAGPPASGQPHYPVRGGYPLGAREPGPYGLGMMPPGRAPGMPYPGTQRGSTALGITAMVLGIAGLATFGTLVIPQVLAIVFGHLSLKREPDARGFAVAALIMGYLVSGLWVLLILGMVAFTGLLG